MTRTQSTLPITEDFINRYKRGDAIHAMASHFGCGKETINRTVKAANLAPRLGSRERKITIDDRFRELWLSGAPIKDIAEEYGCSVYTVGKAVDMAKLPRRGRSWAKGPRVPKPKPAPKRKPDPVPEPRDALPSAVFNASRDGAIVRTKGKYADLAALAAKWGLPTTRVVARWHLVRP